MPVLSSPASNRNPLVSLLVTVAIIACIYFAAKGLFWLLNLIVIPLFIITLILDYKVVLNYFKWLGTLVQNSPLSGVAMGALTVMAYPVIVAFLFAKALIVNRFQKIMQNNTGHNNNPHQAPQHEDEYIEYEEIKEEPIERPKAKVRTDYSGKDFV